MIASECRGRSLVDMTVKELAQLILLNECCIEIEQWTLACVARNADASTCTDATVHVRYRPGDGSFKAHFDVALSTLEAGERMGPLCEGSGCRAIAAPLAELWSSPLFIALHRHLEYDWRALLAVCDVHADLSLSLSRASGIARCCAIHDVKADAVHPD